MPQSDQVSQLVLQVSAETALAQRNLNELARVVQQSSGQMNASLAANDGAIASTNESFAKFGSRAQASRFAMEDLNRVLTRSVDAYGAGMSPLRILTTEMGRLDRAANALGGAGGALGATAQFLAGPWGLAIIVGVAALAKLVQKHLEHGEALDEAYAKLVKHKQETELNSRAEDIWSHSLDGLIERSQKLNEELNKRLQTQTDLGKQTLAQAHEEFAAANAAAAKIETDPNSTQAQIDQAQKAIHDTSIALHNAQVLAGQDAGEAIASITKSAKVWADEQLHALQVIQGYHPELAEKAVADQMLASYEELKSAINDAAAADYNFNDAVTQTDKLNQALASGAINVQTYDQKIRALAQSLRDAAAASKDAVKKFEEAVVGAEGVGPNRLGSSAAGYGQFMPSTFEHYFKQLYPQQAAGMSTAEIDALRNNKEVATAVIDAATQDYVNVLKRAGQQITAASLYTVHVLGAGEAQKLFNAPANEPTSDFLSGKVLKGNPFLQGTAADARAALAKRIGDSSGSVSSGAAAIQKELDDQAKQALDQFDRYSKASDQLDAEILGAKKSLSSDYNAQADSAEQELQSQTLAQIAAVQKEVDDKQLNVTQGQILVSKIKELAAAKQSAIEQQRIVHSLEADQAAMDQRYGFALDDLKFANDNATTQAEHRKIQLEILDIQYEQKLVDLQILLAKQEQLGDLQGAALTQGNINRLGTQKAEDRRGVINGTLDPLQAWAKQVPQTAAQINEALQSIEVQGIDNLASSIAGVITGTQKLGDAFKSISTQIVGDIVQMITKMLIFRALSSVFGSTFGGDIPAPDFSMPASVDLAPAAPLLHMATGGVISIGGNGGIDSNLLSINGQGVAMVSQGEQLAVIPQASRIPTPQAANSNSPQHVLVELSLDDDMLNARILRGAGEVVLRAGPSIAAAGSRSAIRSLSRPRLNGR